MKKRMPNGRSQYRWAACVASGFAAWMLILSGTLLVASVVRAEPYMAVRDGYKCSQCHINKTGGGPRTDYATVYLQTRLAAGSGATEDAAGARAGDAGQGRVGPMSFGADLRASLMETRMNHATATTTFGRPAACESCHSGSTNGVGAPGGGKVAEAYIRYQPVADASIVYSASFLPTTATRDFYGLVEALPMNGYVKAGTFKLPNGLQNTWDMPFQHVTQGGYKGIVGFETVYGTGVEVGFEPGPFSISLSATNPDNLTNSPREKRYFLAASAVSSLGMIGINVATDPVSSTLTRTLTGAYLGFSVGRVTVLGEMDQIDDRNSATGTSASQLASLAEVNFLVMRGHNLKYQLEVRDPSLAHIHDVRDRQSFIYDAFLTPYLQARVGYRLYAGPQSLTNDNNGHQWFVEGHFVF
jgi:hypothetical protein